MANLKKSRNLFLEKEEIVRQDRFMREDGYKDFIIRATGAGGITTNSAGVFGNNFLFQQGSSYLKIALSENSIAYNTQGDRIYYKHQSNYEWGVPFIPAATKETWIYVEYGTTSIEEGTVSLATNGVVTGVGTKFTEVFRGQTTLVPNKMRIYERASNIVGGDGYTYTLKGTYEINEVVDDTNLFLNTESALSAGDYVYTVVGAFSPGSFDDSREEEIYEYDSPNMVFSDTDPSGSLTADQYILCKVTIDTVGLTQTIVDLRKNKYSLKLPKDVVFEEFSATEIQSLQHNTDDESFTLTASKSISLNSISGVVSVTATVGDFELDRILASFSDYQELILYIESGENVDILSTGSTPGGFDFPTGVGTLTVAAGSIVKLMAKNLRWQVLSKSL
jgi:hypothetical protein